jgi:two-component sensor histidine kinase/PAS domain-containing protein
MSSASSTSPQLVTAKNVKDELLRSMEGFQVMLVYICSTLLFSWTIFDYFLFPTLYKQFALARFVSAIIPVAVCYFRKKLRVNSTHCIFILALSITILDSYVINIIPEKEFKTFSLACIMFFIGVGMLALWEIYYSIILVLFTLILNGILFYFFSPVTLEVYLLNGQFAVFTVAVFSILMVNIRYKSVSKEIKARLELELSGKTIQDQRDRLSEYANQMEKLVSHRTEELREKSIKINKQKTFYDAIFFNIPIEIVIFNEQQEYMFANKMAIPKDDIRELIIGKNDKEYCSLINLDAEKAGRRQSFFQKSLSDKIPVDFEEGFSNDSGEIIYKQFGFFPIYDSGALQFMIFYANDISAKKKYEVEIEDSLKEKEALLGEIHHRVKNNLALIIGLIEFQKVKLVEQSVIHELDEIKNRISSISIIHETLYKSANFASVDIGNCIKEVITVLKSLYGKSKEIKLITELETILIPTKLAIPISLMVNEMITNCYKHAFNEMSTGEIKTQLFKNGESLEIIISDNGKGYNIPTDPLKSNSLGMKLISIFVKQLKGKIEFDNLSGLRIRVIIPLQQKIEG